MASQGCVEHEWQSTYSALIADLCCCRFREGNAFGGGVAPLPATILYNFCVLTPAPQLSLAYNLCFDSCNNALVCTNVDVPPAVAAAGTLVPANAACQRIIDSTSAGNRQQISNCEYTCGLKTVSTQTV